MQNQKGQSTLEYILLLVVVVGVIAVFSTVFYKPFGQFVDNYMGSYLQCLLDFGELPKLGSDDPNLNCESEFKPFTLGQGRPPIGTSPTGKDGKSENSTKDERKEMADSRSGGASATGAGAVSQRMYTSGQDGVNGATADSNVAAEYPELSETQYQKVPRNYGGGSYQARNRIKITEVESLSYVERAKAKKNEKKTTPIAQFEEGEAGDKAKVIPVKPPERKAASDQTDEPFTFGKLIRIAIILMLIIAILVFLAGQILQISKSWEK